MTGPQAVPAATLLPTDSDDDDDDDVLDNADDLPDDVPNDALNPIDVQVAAGNLADTDVDAPVLGRPLLDDEIGP